MNKYGDIFSVATKAKEKIREGCNPYLEIDKIIGLVSGLMIKDFFSKYNDLMFRDDIKIIEKDFNSVKTYLIVDKKENMVMCPSGGIGSFRNEALSIKAYKEFPKKVVQPIRKWNKEFGVKMANMDEKDVDIREYISIVLKSEITANIESFNIEKVLSKYIQGENRKFNIIMLGAPGAGKGTLSKTLSRKLDIPHISTGDIIRTLIKKGNNPEFKTINQGGFITDDAVARIVMNRLKEDDCFNGFILDGFPRTEYQKDIFINMCKESGLPSPLYINLEVREEVLIKRLTSRKTCKKCGESYSCTREEEIDGICDRCNYTLVKRKDDSIENVKKRMEIFKEKTKPLIDFCKNNRLSLDLNGEDSIKNNIIKIDAKLRIKTK